MTIILMYHRRQGTVVIEYSSILVQFEHRNGAEGQDGTLPVRELSEWRERPAPQQVVVHCLIRAVVCSTDGQ
jgi:hypothetical protein